MRQHQPSTDVRSTSAPSATASSFRTAAGVHDAHTNEGLRAALGEIATYGWDGEAGRAVLHSLTSRCSAWSVAAARAGRTGGGTADAGEVLSLAWLILQGSARNIAAARAPWAYLWICTCRSLAVETVATGLLSTRAVKVDRSFWPLGVTRCGDETRELARVAALNGSLAEGAQADDVPSPGAVAIVGYLAGDDAEEAAFWLDAVGRAIDVMADARRTYQEVALRRDPYLREVLGLSSAELAALGALLVGPRTADRDAQSLLLAVRKDAGARPQDVVGAVDRIAFLTARRHVAEAAMPVVTAA